MDRAETGIDLNVGFSYFRVFLKQGFCMKILVARAGKIFFSISLAIVLTGCDEMGKVASGVGTATRNLSDKITDNDSSDQKPGEGGQQANGETDPESGEDTQNVDGAEDEEAEVGSEQTASETETDPEDEVAEASETDDPSDGRNVEQYPRLPRNVTWKPVSSSAGDNLTIVLWGGGGGEKNYEEGSLRVEHNEGIKYPRKYVRRDDPTNGERAPKFHFDVQGSWFVGKDPVLFWNLGAYRVIHPDRRQGKHEE